MSIIELFFASAGISFLGSLQLGPVNSQVLRQAFQKNRKAAVSTALGGSLPEILYAGLAAILIQSLHAYSTWQFYFRILFIVVISGLGIYYLLHDRKQVSNKEIKQTRRPFLNGFVLAILNPQLIFFWSGILVLLGVDMPSKGQISAFALGACVGALLLLLTFTFIGFKLSENKLFSKAQFIDRVLGFILLAIGLGEGIRMTCFA